MVLLLRASGNYQQATAVLYCAEQCSSHEKAPWKAIRRIAKQKNMIWLPPEYHRDITLLIPRNTWDGQGDLLKACDSR